MFPLADRVWKKQVAYNAWLPSLGWLREDPRFYERMREAGTAGYWATYAFPPAVDPSMIRPGTGWTAASARHSQSKGGRGRRRRRCREADEIPSPNQSPTSYAANPLDAPGRGRETAQVTASLPKRRPSASATDTLQSVPRTARARVLRALELGRRGQLLRKLGDHARSSDLARAR